jgi:ATP-dependent DNA helicase RecQ
MYNDHYRIQTADYRKRKQNFEARVKAMIGYISKSKGCRSQHIAGYFTDVKINACGICDNCINEKVLHISTEEFKQITGRLTDCIKDKTVFVEDILVSLTGIKKEKVWQVIHYLLAEGKMQYDKDGKLSFMLKT